MGAVVMKVMSHAHVQRVEQVEAPPPVVAQMEKPSPVAGQPEAQPAAPSKPPEEPPKVVTFPVAEPGAPARPHPGSRIRDRLTPRPVSAPPEQAAATPAPPAPGVTKSRTPVPKLTSPPAPRPKRVIVARNQPPPQTQTPRAASPAIPPSQRNSGSASGQRTFPDEVSVPEAPAAPGPPLPLPEARQDRPAPPATPPVRMEPENTTPAPPPPPEHHRATLNAGMIIPVRLLDSLSTEHNRPGDRFAATLVHELIAGDFVIAERGARVEGQVVASSPARMGGVAILTIMLTRLYLSDGQVVVVRTDGFEKRADLPVRPGDGRGVMPKAGMAATLPAETRIPFRLGVPVNLTERTL